MKPEAHIWIYSALFSLFTMGFCQLGPTEHCIDLLPQNNLTLNKLSGTWLGVEFITHRDMISGEKSSKDCIFVVITEISHIVSRFTNLHRIIYNMYIIHTPKIFQRKQRILKNEKKNVFFLFKSNSLDAKLAAAENYSNSSK